MYQVIIKLTYEGLHRWEDCPFEDVSYLREYHRHVFHIKAWKKVEHANREIEVIRLKNDVKRYLSKRYKNNFGNMSCEMIAEDIAKQFDFQKVEVLEDNENGASYEQN